MLNLKYYIGNYIVNTVYSISIAYLTIFIKKYKFHVCIHMHQSYLKPTTPWYNEHQLLPHISSRQGHREDIKLSVVRDFPIKVSLHGYVFLHCPLRGTGTATFKSLGLWQTERHISQSHYYIFLALL